MASLSSSGALQIFLSTFIMFVFIQNSDEQCFCTKELFPVCSAQGIQFPNECVLLCEAVTDPSIVMGCPHPCPCSEGVPTKRPWPPQPTRPPVIKESTVSPFQPSTNLTETSSQPSTSFTRTSFQPSPGLTRTSFQPSPGSIRTSFQPSPGSTRTSFRPSPGLPRTSFKPSTTLTRAPFRPSTQSSTELLSSSSATLPESEDGFSTDITAQNN